MNNRIALWRKYRGMTQEELAKRTGLTRQTVSKIENDMTSTTVKTLLKISDALGVHIEALFF